MLVLAWVTACLSGLLVSLMTLLVEQNLDRNIKCLCAVALLEKEVKTQASIDLVWLTAGMAPPKFVYNEIEGGY